MAVAITIGCWLVAVLFLLQSKFIFHPIAIMFVIWGILIPISAQGVYGVYIPSDHSYTIIGIGLLGYFIGAVLGRISPYYKFTFGKHDNSEYDKSTRYVLRYNLLYILNWVAIIYFIIQSVVVMKLLMSGYDYSYIRDLAVSEDYNVLRQSKLMTNLRVFIATPLTYLDCALLPIEIFYGRKDRKLILQVITMIFLWVFTSGGRSVIVWETLYFACVLLVRKRTYSRIEWKNLFSRYKVPILFGGSALLIFLYVITISRKGEGVDFLKQFYIYYVAPLSFFDHHIKELDNATGYVMGYGVSSFYGFLYPFLYVIKSMTGTYSPFIEGIYYRSFGILEHGVDIGGGIWMNAFATFFYQPYLDGRYVGTFIILLIFGYLCMKVYRRAKLGDDPKYLLLYLLLLQKITDSMVRFYFTQQVQALSFVLAIIIMKKVTDQDTATN